MPGYIERRQDLEGRPIAERHAEARVIPERVVVTSGIVHPKVACLSSTVDAISTENVLVHVPCDLNPVRCVNGGGFTVGRRCKIGADICLPISPNIVSIDVNRDVAG